MSEKTSYKVWLQVWLGMAFTYIFIKTCEHNVITRLGNTCFYLKIIKNLAIILPIIRNVSSLIGALGKGIHVSTTTRLGGNFMGVIGKPLWVVCYTTIILASPTSLGIFVSSITISKYFLIWNLSRKILNYSNYLLFLVLAEWGRCRTSDYG